MKKLGIPTTLGELRKMTEQYPDETLLQFRNEPRHELTFEDQENMGLIFQEGPSTDLPAALKRILANNAFNFGNMQIDIGVRNTCKAIYYLTGQLPFVGRYSEDNYKEECREYIDKIIENTVEILNKP